VAELREALGLSMPLHEQYWQWLGQVARGDLGESIALHRPVRVLIAQHFMPTLLLALLAMVFSFAIAVGTTTWNAVKPGSVAARVAGAASSVAVAVPEFWIALVFVFIFGVRFDLLPTSGYVDPFVDPLGAARHFVLPVASIVIGLSAHYTLVLRESVLRELTRLYLRTARVKGLGEARVVFGHVLRNAMLPCVTVMGTSFAHMVGGIVIIEAIFVIPGLGSLLLDAIQARDYVLVQGVTIFVALLFVVVNLLVDLSYLALDPKVRVS